MVAGESSRTAFPVMTLPVTGDRMSEADLTDSMAPMVSPGLTSVSGVGSST